MNKLILLSGGLDSAVCLAMNPSGHTLFVNYNQEAKDKERRASRKISQAFGSKHHEVGIFTENLEVDHVYADIKGVVPMRNCLLISVASMVGKTTFGDSDVEVIIGVQKGDNADFVDCRASFIEQMNEIAVAFGVSISAPLLTKSRAEVQAMAEEYDKATSFIRDIWSCYRGNESGPCGECLSCRQ